MSDALTVTVPLVDPRTLIPCPAFPSISPVALISISPEPKLLTKIPKEFPMTPAVRISVFRPAVSLVTLIPSPAVPANLTFELFVLTTTEPPALLSTRIPCPPDTPNALVVETVTLIPPKPVSATYIA